MFIIIIIMTPISFSSYGVLIPGLNKTINCSINSGRVDIMKNKQMKGVGDIKQTRFLHGFESVVKHITETSKHVSP